MDERTMLSADKRQPNQKKFINLYRLLERPKALQDRIFQKLFDQAEIAKYSESERRQYEESRKDYWDYYSTVTTAEKKGRAEGLAEGMEKGLAEGMEKGRAEGMEKGMAEGMEKGLAEGMEKGMEKGQQQEKVETVHRLQALGLSVELIAQGTGLTAEEVKSIIA